jgi:hypothetical protein
MNNILPFIKKHKHAFVVGIKILFLGLLCYNIYSKLAEEGFKQSFEHFKEDFNLTYLWYLVPVFLLVFVNWGLEAYKWFISTKYIQSQTYWESYKTILMGNAMNQIVPAGMGEVVGRALMYGEGNKLKAGALTYFSQMPQKVAQMVTGVLFLIFVLSQGWLTSSFFHWLVVIGLGDAAIWYVMFFHTDFILPYIKRLKFMSKAIQYLESIENFRKRDKFRLLGLSLARYLVFTLQYVLMSFIFFKDLKFGYYFCLSSVNFLLQSVVPSVGFLDLGVRGNLAFMAFEPMMYNMIGVLSVSYAIWIINLLIPSAVGFFFLWQLRDEDIIES